MNPFPLLFATVLACGLLAPALAGGAATPPPAPAGANVVTWATDLPRAQAQARAEGKAVLINFTGSDWCGWCIRLKRDVFLKPDFAGYAKSNLVLVEIDFPKRKRLPAESQAANRRLAQQFQVQGYPTLILLAADGTRLGNVNYANGGTRTFLSEVEKILRPPAEPAVVKKAPAKTPTPKRQRVTEASPKSGTKTKMRPVAERTTITRPTPTPPRIAVRD